MTSPYWTSSDVHTIEGLTNMGRRPDNHPATQHEVASSNSTLNAFLGGKQKSWMTGNAATFPSNTVRPSAVRPNNSRSNTAQQSREPARMSVSSISVRKEYAFIYVIRSTPQLTILALMLLFCHRPHQATSQVPYHFKLRALLPKYYLNICLGCLSSSKLPYRPNLIWRLFWKAHTKKAQIPISLRFPPRPNLS